MTIRVSSKRNKTFLASLTEAYGDRVRYSTNDFAKQLQAFDECRKVLAWLAESGVSIDDVGCWDITRYDIQLQCDNVRIAGRVLRQLHTVGVSFADASYEYSHTDNDGKEWVTVSRRVQIAGLTRLTICWKAEHKGKGKCKIVELVNTSTYKSLVCST